MTRKYLVLLIGVLVMGLFVAQVGAQSSVDFDLEWNALTGGGSTASSADFMLSGSIGQAMADHSAGSSTDFRMASGFLQFTNSVPTVVGLDSAETAPTLTPFWLIVAASLLLLSAAVWLRLRA